METTEQQQEATDSSEGQSPHDQDGGNNVNTLSFFLSRLRQMPTQKQQQLVSTSMAIVRNNTTGNSANNNNNEEQPQPTVTREKAFEVVYGSSTKGEKQTAAKQDMCFVVDAGERRVRIVSKEEQKKQESRLIFLEDIPEEQYSQFGRSFPEEQTAVEGSDRFVHCESCDRYYDFSCLTHPLYQCQDRTPIASLQTANTEESTRAGQTLPGILFISNSHIPNAGKGVFAKLDIPVGIVFGPYEGILLQDAKKASQDGYAWELRVVGNGKQSYFIDGKDPRYSNWMRYINSSRHESEQNLIAFQYRGCVFYKVYRPIDKHSELLVRKELWQRTRHHKRSGH